MVDEALSVGDLFFQKKCYNKIGELIEKGVTLLFVSHSEEMIRTLTSRAVLLHHGRIQTIGAPAETIIEYRKLLHADESAYLATQAGRHYSCNPKAQAVENAEVMPEAPSGGSFGNHQAEIVSVSVTDERGNACTALYPGDFFTIKICCRLNMNLTHLNVAFRIRNKEGIKITSWGTLNDDIKKWNDGITGGFWETSFSEGDTVTVSFSGKCTLGPNLYEIQATVTEEADKYYTAQHVLHWKDEAAFFKVLHKPREYVFGGICDLQLDCRVGQ
ncbi:Wzt carbohydrate-binding domain-containing protein [Geomonas anaerohicana]|uniref:Wzt carbohydrate-binding domain-containing protein n=1 Tax=Geomonas anaerohicana TaxID=2798583 RepID=UPI0038B27813